MFVSAEKGAEHEVWKSLLELVHNLCEILLQTIPNFWKVAKGYMDGKYQRKDSSNDRKKHHNAHRGDDNNSGGGRRNPTQVRVMTNEIINLYISLFSELLTLSSSMATSPRLHDGSGQEANLPALPPFVPPNSNALTTGFYLLKALSELSDCTNDIGGLANIGIEIQNNLKDFLSTVRFRFLESICAVWVRDAKLFWRLEDWTLDNEDLSRTVYLRRIENYLRGTARLAYRASGGNEERASNLFIEGKGIALLRRMGNEVSKRPARAVCDANLTMSSSCRRTYHQSSQGRYIRHTSMPCMTSWTGLYMSRFSTKHRAYPR